MNHPPAISRREFSQGRIDKEREDNGIMVKVLVIDDSALMRRQISQMLTEGGFEVVTARNGVEGLRLLAEENPAVVTLDVNMPEMDGITVLSHIMTENPKPVVMLSSLTEQGSLATLEALELGAVDFVHKPDGTVSHRLEQVRDQILAKVQSASKARISRARGLRSRVAAVRQSMAQPALPPVATVESMGEDYPIVVIGVSTGGPGTLEEVLVGLPADFGAPIVIAQHMPENFTGVFARRLNDMCQLEVIEVRSPQVLQPGRVYIGKGDADLVFVSRAGKPAVAVLPAAEHLLWHPNVDRMVESACKVVSPQRLIGVQLTGMGYDGAEQMARLRQLGGQTIAESEETAVVFGMPAELIKRGGATMVLPCDRIGRQLIDWVARARRATVKR